MLKPTKFPKPTAQLFQGLVEIILRSKEGEKVEPIIVTLLTKNINLKGIVIDFIENSEVVFQIELSNDYAFIKLDNIDGIVIHNYSRFEHLLVGVSTSSIHLQNNVPIRKGDFRRTIMNESKRLSNMMGVEIEIVCDFVLPESSLHIFVIKNFIIDLVSCLISISVGESLKLLNGIENIKVCKGNSLSFHIENKSLIVFDTLEKSYSTFMQRDFFKRLLIDLTAKTSSDSLR